MVPSPDAPRAFLGTGQAYRKPKKLEERSMSKAKQTKTKTVRTMLARRQVTRLEAPRVVLSGPRKMGYTIKPEIPKFSETSTSIHRNIAASEVAE